MVSYRSKNDKFMINGQVISSRRAKQLKNKLESELKLREYYLESELSDKDISVNNRTIKLLCTDNSGNEKIPVTVGFALDEGYTVEDLNTDNIVGWTDKWDTHGEVLIRESQVTSFYYDSDVEFSGFNVKFADSDKTSEFEDTIKEWYE